MTALAIALVVLGFLAASTVRYLSDERIRLRNLEMAWEDGKKRALTSGTDLEDLKADIVRIKTMLNIRTVNFGGEKK